WRPVRGPDPIWIALIQRSGPTGWLARSRGRLLDRAQEAAQFAGDVLRRLHRADVARSAEYDQLRAVQHGLHRLADRYRSSYIVVGVQQERRYVDFRQHVALIGIAGARHRPK